MAHPAPYVKTLGEVWRVIAVVTADVVYPGPGLVEVVSRLRRFERGPGAMPGRTP